MTSTTTTASPTAAPTPNRPDTGVDAVTGAFSYSGRAIAKQLISRGREVRTLTGHPDRAPASTPIDVRRLDFDDLPALVDSLQGVTTLFNTYWVRFARGRVDHSLAVENSRTLFQAAKRAGVRKIVHVSILHPSASSPYPYFKGKALVERSLLETGIPYASLRPSVLFDEDGVLLNNIAYLLRRIPIFAVGAKGDYRIRPIHTDDLATLACNAATWTDDRIVDAVGPDRPTFVELVEEIRAAVGGRAKIVHVPGPVLIGASKCLGAVLRDQLLTKDEYGAMSDGLADSTAEATGATRVAEWITDHRDTLGIRYANEVQRHFK